MVCWLSLTYDRSIVCISILWCLFVQFYIHVAPAIDKTPNLTHWTCTASMVSSVLMLYDVEASWRNSRYYSNECVTHLSNNNTYNLTRSSGHWYLLMNFHLVLVRGNDEISATYLKRPVIITNGSTPYKWPKDEIQKLLRYECSSLFIIVRRNKYSSSVCLLNKQCSFDTTHLPNYIHFGVAWH